MANRDGAGVSSAAPAVVHALSEWTKVLGQPFVFSDPAALSEAETATFETSSSVAAVLKPADREEVQRCVEIANRFRIPLYPISTGKNWGYGSRAPVRD